MAKKLRDEDLRLNIIINGDNGRKEMAALERSIQDTNAKLEALHTQRRKLEQQGKTETATYRRVQAQISRYNKELDITRQKLAALQRQQNVSTMTLAEVRAHISRVQIQLNRTDPKSPLWAKLNAELKLSKQRLAELTAQSRVTQGVIGSLADRLNRYIGLASAGFASMAFLFTGFNRARKEMLEYDESLVDAMKTTNLTREEITELSQSLKEIDTRTSQNDLLALVRIGGKLGIQGQNDLLAFASAADKINVALREDLGGDAEDAIREIGKLVDIFNLSGEYGLERSMLMTGSAINSLGMASTANEGYIVEFTKRLAGIAPNADISIDKVLGLAATLDKYGQMSETSATALGQSIIGMYKNTEAFAKVAKMELKEFRDLLNVDANEALLRVIEGMGTDNGGMTAVTKALDAINLNGQRASTVLGSLAKHSDELRAQQEISNRAFMEGSSILEEFNTKNQSATAILEKRKKAVVEQAVALGQQLNPIVNVSLSASSWSLKILGQLVTMSIKHRAVLIALATAYGTNLALRKGAVAWAQAEALWKQRKILLSGQYRTALAREAVSIYATRNAETAATKSTMLWCAAKNLFIGNIRAASLAMKGFFASLSPIGLATLTITGLVSIGRGLASQYQEATKAKRLFNDCLKTAATDAAKERAELDRLKGRLEGCKKGTDEYRKAKEEIISRFGKYDSSLNSETLTVETLTEKYDSLTAAIYRTYNARQYAQFSSEQTKMLDETMTENLDKIYARLLKELGNEQGAKLYTQIAQSLLGGTELEQEVVDVLDRIQDKGTIFADARIDGWIRNIRKAQKAAEDLDALARARFGITNDNMSGTSTGTAIGTGTGGTGAGPGTTDSGNGDDDQGFGDWSLDKDAAFLQKRHALKRRYLTGEIESEREYNRLLLAIEIEALQTRLNKNLDLSEQQAKIQNELDDKLLQQKAERNKWSLASDESYLAAQLDLKRRYLSGEVATEAEYDELAAQLEIVALQNRLDLNIEKGEERMKLEQQLADRLLAQRQRDAQRQVDINSILSDAEANKIDQENRRYEVERRKYAGQADVLEALAKRHARRITKIQLDAANDSFSRQQAQYELARKTMQNRHRQELATFAGTSRQRKDLRRQQYQELAAFDAKQLQHLADQLQLLIDTGSIDDIQMNVSLLSDDEILDLRGQLQDLVERLQSAQGMSEDIGVSHADNGATLLGMSSSQWEELFSGNLENWKEWADGVADIVSGVGDATMQLWSAIDRQQTAIENKQLKTFQANNNKKKKALEKRLNAGLITENQYNTQIEAMDTEYDAFQEELALKQAKRQRAMDISSAIINTAVGVTKSLTGMPWPLNIIAAAATGAMGAAQIALIASTPISTGAEDGGFQDVVRKQDGRRFHARLNPDERGFIEAPTLLVAENGAEYVIPNEGLSNPTLIPFINTLETARRNGMLRSLNFETIYSPTTSPGFARGGYTGEIIPSPDGGAGESGGVILDSGLAGELREAIASLVKVLGSPIRAHVSLLGKNGLLEQMDKYERNRDRGKLGGL